MGNLKHIVACRAPGFLTAAAWWLRRLVRPNAAQRFQQRIYAQLGEPREVMRGPFRGMRYGRLCYGGSTLMRALALYELELHPWVEELIAAEPDVVVDVGTSDGYYLVGLARRLPRARLVGFDSVPVCRTLTRRTARMNGVSGRVSVRGYCTAEQLQQALQGASRPAVICDCDSGELAVMDPTIATNLRRATILLEVHDDIKPGISEEMRRRFSGTHVMSEIPARPRRVEDFPPELGVEARDAQAVMNEMRPPGNFWLYMTPRSSESPQVEETGRDVQVTIVAGRREGAAAR